MIHKIKHNDNHDQNENRSRRGKKEEPMEMEANYQQN
jgi:hypothetical protein